MSRSVRRPDDLAALHHHHATDVVVHENPARLIRIRFRQPPRSDVVVPFVAKNYLQVHILPPADGCVLPNLWMLAAPCAHRIRVHGSQTPTAPVPLNVGSRSRFQHLAGWLVGGTGPRTVGITLRDSPTLESNVLFVTEGIGW